MNEPTLDSEQKQSFQFMDTSIFDELENQFQLGDIVWARFKVSSW